MRQAIAEASGAELVTVRIAHVPDASADEDRCDRREYWLSRPSGDLLVATDCEYQWGADNAGPATVEVRHGRLHVSYSEFRSSDRCEIYLGTVDPTGAKVGGETRLVGTVVEDACRPSNKRLAVDPNGDGTAEHPLLVLHR